MENTGGEPTHAVGGLDEKKIEKAHPKHPSTDSTNGVDEKREHGIDSSSSSSRGEPAIKKLDSKIIKVPDTKEGEEALASLPEHEREIIKRQLDIPPVKVNYLTLYKYATRVDWVILAVSALCAIVGGAALPLSTVRPVTSLDDRRKCLHAPIGCLWQFIWDLSGLFLRRP